MQAAHPLLIAATQKLIELRRDCKWALQLPDRCPPVLWFGNTGSPKSKVVTVGANPSRQEFLRDDAPTAAMKVRQTCDHSLLSYLEPPHNRFRVLMPGESLEDIHTSSSLREEIIASYNNYFHQEPYEGWFGHNRENSYKVEGFLRGLGASYYGSAPIQAIHIDLFPFATLSDFGRIVSMASANLFTDGWAQRLVYQLVANLRPNALAVFGRTNARYFRQFIDPAGEKPIWRPFGLGKYHVAHSERLGVPVVGLSTNLGNPKGFSAKSIREFGSHIGQIIEDCRRTGS